VQPLPHVRIARQQRFILAATHNKRTPNATQEQNQKRNKTNQRNSVIAAKNTNH
jgi:hypothetical protein